MISYLLCVLVSYLPFPCFRRTPATNLLSLPNELLFMIIPQLSPRTRLALSHTCRRLYNISPAAPENSSAPSGNSPAPSPQNSPAPSQSSSFPSSSRDLGAQPTLRELQLRSLELRKELDAHWRACGRRGLREEAASWQRERSASNNMGRAGCPGLNDRRGEQRIGGVNGAYEDDFLGPVREGGSIWEGWDPRLGLRKRMLLRREWRRQQVESGMADPEDMEYENLLDEQMCR